MAPAIQALAKRKIWEDKKGWQYGYRNTFEAKIEVLKRSL